MRHSLISAAALSVIGLFGASASAANILTDPGFESNPIGPAFNTALNNFTTYQNQWSPETGGIVGPQFLISPSSGNLQLQLLGTAAAGTTAQTGQIVDVTSYAGIIDANLAVINASALLNSDAPAAIGGIYVSFYTSSNLGSVIGGNPGNVLSPLDGLPSTWESVSLTAAIPANTRWIVYQVAYDSASINGTNTAGLSTAGYADDTFAEIRAVPEPASLAAIGVAAVGLLIRRRRAVN